MARSSSPAVSADVENNLIRTTGDRKAAYGARPNGYTIFTPEKRMMVILTAEHRATPDTDEKCITAFRSMFAYSGIYRVDVDRFITKVDISWNEAWTGTEQVRFFKSQPGCPIRIPPEILSSEAYRSGEE